MHTDKYFKSITRPQRRKYSLAAQAYNFLGIMLAVKYTYSKALILTATNNIKMLGLNNAEPPKILHFFSTN